MTESGNSDKTNLNRRDVLGVGVATVAAATSLPTFAAADEDRPFPVVDTNVSMFQWPFRRLPLDETTLLVGKLKSLGVTEAWAGSFEALLHRDISEVNRRLIKECTQHAMLQPIGSINPALPSWQNDLRFCMQHNVRGIRLHPNYHNYTLDTPAFKQLLQMSSQARLVVQICAAMEDTRTQHSSLQVQDVDLSPLSSLVSEIPSAKVQILNYRPRGNVFAELAKHRQIFFDTSRVDSTDGVPNLVAQVSARRVLFGSHAPFLIPEAALIRLNEAGRLDVSTMQSVLSANAAQLCRRGGV